jgi:type II secretory pathway pseudopilin PulG
VQHPARKGEALNSNRESGEEAGLLRIRVGPRRNNFSKESSKMSTRGHQRLHTAEHAKTAEEKHNPDKIGTANSVVSAVKPGSTLVEVMLAITILIIALIGTSSTYVTGRRQLASQRQYQVAALLASQKLEETEAAGYAGITEGEEEETITLYGLSYQRQTQIVLTATPTTELPKPCKKVTVTIQWSGSAGDRHNAKLVTYIGP